MLAADAGKISNEKAAEVIRSLFYWEAG